MEEMILEYEDLSTSIFYGIDKKTIIPQIH